MSHHYESKTVDSYHLYEAAIAPLVSKFRPIRSIDIRWMMNASVNNLWRSCDLYWLIFSNFPHGWVQKWAEGKQGWNLTLLNLLYQIESAPLKLDSVHDRVPGTSQLQTVVLLACVNASSQPRGGAGDEGWGWRGGGSSGLGPSVPALMPNCLNAFNM